MVSRAFRWARLPMWSAINEQPIHPCSGQSPVPGSMKARYTMSWRRPWNRSSRLTAPSGPSNR
ncbi:Uncharacterised protein [Mycobacteroides abscessus subsp. abscessus]|nr:Uncharacterised protein [Mycobacteroides abscessus subsp. abscessus]